MKNLIIAAALVLSATVTTADAVRPHGDHKPVIAQCIAPIKYEPTLGVSTYPAYMVTMETWDGTRWTAYIDHQWSDFDWRPTSFLYPELYDGDLPNQQELAGVLDRCKELAGAGCRMVGIDQISPNPLR